MDDKIGLIAGSGQFPFLFARTAAERGFRVFTAAYVNEADAELSELSEQIQWVHLGQVTR